LAEEAVCCEPVSAAGFPANREKNREISKIPDAPGELISNHRPTSMVYIQIPYDSEQGIFNRRAGKSI
jgi:hypothetical protein